MRLGVHAGPFSVSGRVGGSGGADAPAGMGVVLVAVVGAVVGVVWLAQTYPWVGWVLLAGACYVAHLVVSILAFAVSHAVHELRAQPVKPRPKSRRMES